MKRQHGDIKKHVKRAYAEIALKGTSCCALSSCCGAQDTAESVSRMVGYSRKDMAEVPEGANLGLGCGNPIALASIKEGDVVLDLGSGAGFDAFLAAKKVGGKGLVIGIDMTPEMINKARANAKKGKYANVEFRLGEIEKLPVKDVSVDIIISNCVINLSPDKKKVFKEAFRVLKPGGRLMISDLVLLKELPETIKESVAAYTGCIAGAINKKEYLECVKDAGFKDIKVVGETYYPVEAMANDATAQVVKSSSLISRKDLKALEHSVASIKLSAIKGGEHERKN